MATITQRLAFLISANADSAIRAFEKTSGSAAKEMAKAEKSLEKAGASLTKFGAAGLAAAGTLGAGLFKLAQGAIDDQKAQALLAQQLRSSTGATQKQIDAVEDLIDKTARATGVADDQLRPALSNLVRAFGDTDKATRVLNTALDLSRATGRDLETVTLALSKAAAGSTGPLSKLGITFDENTKKSKDFDKILAAVNDKVGGASAAYAETYAGKLDRMRVAVSEAGESLGTAFIPVVEKSATALAGSINKLAELNNATGGAIGKFAAFGTVGLGVVSALSLVAGQTIKLRDRFTTLGDDGERSLTKLGNAAKYAGLSIAAIGVSEAVFGILNEISDSAGKTDRALQKLIITLDKTDTSKTVEAFRNLIKEEGGVKRFTNIISDLGKEITIVGGKSGKDIEDIDRAFAKILKESPQAAQSLIDAWRAQNATLDKASGQYKDNVMLIERYQSRVDSLVGSQKALNNINEDGVSSLNELKKTYEDYSRAILRNEERQQQLNIEKLVTAERERQAAADRKAADAAAKFKSEVEALAQALETKLSKALADAESNAEKANAAYKSYRDSIAGSVSGVVNFGNAQATAEQNAKTLTDAITKQKEAQTKLDALLAGKDVDAEKVADARRDLADATKEVTDAEKLPQTFDAVLKGQVGSAETFKTQLQTLLDLGADQALIDQLTSAGADAGGAIIKGILASADPKARVDELDATLASVSKLADTIGTAAADKFFGTGVALASKLLQGVRDTVNDIDVEKLKTGKNPKRNINRATKRVDQSFADLFGLAGLAVPELADGGIVKASAGGTLVRLGEGGRDEAVLPLPSTMQQPTIINVTVNAGMGTDGTQVGKQIVDELVAYQRRVGALPIKVSG